MKRPVAIILAVVMFGVAIVLRRYSNDIVRGFGIVAMFAMWFLLAFAIPLTRWNSGMEEWKLVRQRGRTYFVLVQGGWWLFFLFFISPSIDFASGDEIRFHSWWIWLLGGILAGPVLHFWDWRGRERKFHEWQKTGPLPDDGVA